MRSGVGDKVWDDVKGVKYEYKIKELKIRDGGEDKGMEVKIREWM